MGGFLNHCLTDTNYATGKVGAPLDLVLFHAKGAPKVIDDTVVMSIRQQMNNIAGHFKEINSFAALKNIPIVIGESDPEGCAACGMATNPENAYRNGTMYSSYTAAALARTYELMDDYHENLIGAVNWSFEFENQPWFAGFRDLATNGVDKPVLNVFRMLGMMKGQRAYVAGTRMYELKTILDSGIRGNQTDIGALAANDEKSVSVMIWNYADKDKQSPGEPVNIHIHGLAPGVSRFNITEYRIDDTHSNSYEAWKKMGSPQHLTQAQITELQNAGQLQILGKPKIVKVIGGNTNVNISLPRQAVSLLILKPVN